MENVSKALIIAASVLIAVMLFTFMMYMFKHMGEISDTTQKRMSSQSIDAFNSHFMSYATIDSTGESFKDTSTGRNQSIEYRNLFQTTSVIDRSYYKQALIVASQNLNKVTDVVSAVNLAIDINSRNNNDYKYNYLEVVNTVEVIVDLGAFKNDFAFNASRNYQYLLLEPNKGVKPNTMYGLSGSGSDKISTDKRTNFENKYINATEKFKIANEVNLYDVLTQMRASKVIEYENRTYTVYKYYFTGSYELNEETGLIETVKFTLLKDCNF